MPEGKITISRYHNTEIVCISIMDVISRVEFVKFEMTVSDFGKAITGLGYVTGNMELRKLNLIGKKAENKDVVIKCEFPYGDKMKMRKARKAMKEFEVDGWKGRDYDLGNPHNYATDGIRVCFSRHVTMPVEG